MKLVENEYLRQQVLKRIAELGWKDSFLLNDAAERGMKIAPARWSQYKKNKSGQITDEMLYWIATRIGIDINLRFGKPVFDGKKIEWTIQPYNELECIKKVNSLKGEVG